VLVEKSVFPRQKGGFPAYFEQAALGGWGFTTLNTSVALLYVQ
jgi:hypothetical protein